MTGTEQLGLPIRVGQASSLPKGMMGNQDGCPTLPKTSNCTARELPLGFWAWFRYAARDQLS